MAPLVLVTWMLAGGCASSDADCIPTWGDGCECVPQCLTGQQIDAIDARCEAGCGDDGTVPGEDWTCESRLGVCVVSE